jgi:hypothetical protein
MAAACNKQHIKLKTDPATNTKTPDHKLTKEYTHSLLAPPTTHP